MAHDAARTERSSRFHSSGSERGHAAHAGHAAPAPDYVYGRAAGDFDPYDDFDDLENFADASSTMADDLIDDLIPPEVDWRRIVRRHPFPALLVAGLAGYLLGRSQGRTLVRALSTLAVARVEAEVLDRIEDDFD